MSETMPQMSEYWVKDSIKDKLFEDHYTLGSKIGSGATAEVFKCQQRGTNQQWAVKILPKLKERKAVKSECGVLLRLTHKNVIRLKEVYETQQKIYLVLELVAGGELFDRIVWRGKYTEKDAAELVRQLLEAIKYLHDNDIVHRDLKPENILFEDNREDSPLKLADFGLAAIIGPDIQLQTVCGTPEYCAPEVLTANTYTSAVDLWSLGVITYILLCGYMPFYGLSDAMVFKEILKCEYSFVPQDWSPISENAKDFVKKLLVKDPKERLTAPQALAHSWVRGTAKDDPMVSTQEKLKEFNARRKIKSVSKAIMAVNGMMGRMGSD